MLCINSPYNLYEKELKSIESKYREFFTASNSNYAIAPLDLVIILDASEDTESTSTSYITQYIKDQAKTLIGKLRENIFADESFYNDNTFHLYITSSKAPSLLKHDSWLYAYAIDAQHHDVIISERITANQFIPFCKRIYQLQSKDERTRISQLLKKLRSLKSNIASLPYKGELSYEYQIKVIPNDDVKDFEYRSLEFNLVAGTLRTKEYKEICALVHYTDIQSNFKLKELKTFSFTPGKECVYCNKQFSGEDYQYYCYWCKESFCVSCVECKFKENTYIDRYFHKFHNLLYFKTRKEKEDLEELDEYKLGSNSFVGEESLGNTHNVSCNGCRNGFSQRQQANPRYICVTCTPGMFQPGGFCDFCYNCIVDYRERKGRFNSLESDVPEHDEDHHVYFLVICSSGGYQDY